MVNSDIFVIGGGPAGLAAAIAARRRGFHVTVADQVEPPADKACGEGLMPDALMALANLGLAMNAPDSFPFRGIRFLDRGVEVAASFPSGAGRGVRRTTLHRIMADYAESIGVKLLWGTRIDLDSLRCGWIVAADGENSLVRRRAGLDRRLHDERRFGFRRHYRLEPWTDYMELYWGEGHQAYVTPVTSDSICVVAISRNPRLRLDDALLSFPLLAQRLKPDAIIAGERGAVTSSRKLQRVYRDRIALIGDASGSVDAITGEGLCLAFRQAIRAGGGDRARRFRAIRAPASSDCAPPRVDGKTVTNAGGPPRRKARCHAHNGSPSKHFRQIVDGTRRPSR